MGKESLLRRITKKEWAMTAVFLCFLIVEIALYITFIVMDARDAGDAVPYKYSAIILCMLLSFLYFGKPETEKLLVSGAMILTVLADAFLLVMDMYYEFGIVCFIFVQLSYMARIYCLNGAARKIWITAAVRIGVSIAAIGVLGGIGALSAVNALSAVCYVNLLANAVESVVCAVRKNKSVWLFAVGLILFCACDLCVGLNNILTGGELQRFTNVAMWAFYLPSQVLIVLSRFTRPAGAQTERAQDDGDGGTAAKNKNGTAESTDAYSAENVTKES